MGTRGLRALLSRSAGRRRLLGTAALGLAIFLLAPITARALVGGFQDVPEGHTHATGIEFASSSGIGGGYNDNTFRPGEYVTRGQMSTFLHRMASQQVAAGIHVRHAAGEDRPTVVDAFNNVNRTAPSVIAAGGPGAYLISFGFPVSDKMLQVTAVPAAGNLDVIATAGPAAGGAAVVNLYDAGDAAPTRGEFYLLVYGR